MNVTKIEWGVPVTLRYDSKYSDKDETTVDGVVMDQQDGHVYVHDEQGREFEIDLLDQVIIRLEDAEDEDSYVDRGIGSHCEIEIRRVHHEDRQ